MQQEARVIVLLDAGDLFGGPGHAAESSSLQQRLAAETLVEGMSLLGYDALGVGEGELLFGGRYLRQLASTATFPFLSSSLYRHEAGEEVPLLVRTVVIDAGPLRLGLASVLDEDFGEFVRRHQDPGEPLIVRAMAEAARGSLDDLAAAGADLRVLLAHLPAAGMPELLRDAQGFEIVIGGHDTLAEHFAQPRMIEGSAVVQSGWEGKRIGRLDLRIEPDGRLSVAGGEEVLLDDGFPDDPEMVALHQRYLERVASSIEEILAEHPVRPPASGTRYIGSAGCIPCHEVEASSYQATAHASAFRTLVERSRDYDPECYACHTTGFGYEGGFRLPVRTPAMENVGCESCHGAGADHKAEPEKPYGMPVNEPRCRSCHNQVHSPEFDDAVYRPQVLHPQ